MICDLPKGEYQIAVTGIGHYSSQNENYRELGELSLVFFAS
jgi:hypothetical protein